MSAARQHDHHHDVSSSRPHATAGDERRTLVALFVTFVFMLVEVAGGLISGSLALLADAAHMLADVLALGMAWGAFRLGRLAADPKRSFGYRRFEVLAALANGVTVLGLSAWIVFAAVQRLNSPEAVRGWPMLIVAAIGLAANLLTFRVLGGHRHHHGHDHDHDHDHDHAERNLNLRGAVLHVLGDLLGSAAAVGAAAVILASGWLPIDPILSIAMALLIVVVGAGLVRSAIHILLEGSPVGFDPQVLRAHLLQDVPGLAEVHHVHAWSVTTGEPMLTLHAVVEPAADRDAVLGGIKRVLAEEFGFSHSVVQLEGDGCDDHACR